MRYWVWIWIAFPMKLDMHKTKREGVYLGFDFGTKAIGIAVGQSITKTASPLTTLHAQNGAPHWDQIQEIINEWLPIGLIVGLALQPDGSHSETSRAAQRFGNRLHGRFQLAVHFIEERLTSVEAQARLKEAPPMVQAHRCLDAMAAAIILESWLNDGNQLI